MEETFAGRIRRARIKQQYTQKQLSVVTGISEHTISNYEQGVSLPILDNIALLAKYLHVSCDYLCLGEKMKTLLSDHPFFEQILADYDPEKNEKPLETYSPTSNKKVWWRCHYGHQYAASVKSKFSGFGCPIDSLRSMSLASVRPDLAEEYDREKNAVGPGKISWRSQKKAWWICKKGHRYSMTIVHRVMGGTCPYCSFEQKINSK